MGLIGGLIGWCLRNRAVVIVATIVFVAFGIQGATRLPIDAVPDVTNVQVQIITSAPALAPVEVEQYVTVPVERAMSGIPRVTDVWSISKYGISVVTVVFEDGTDIYFARQQIAERLRDAEAEIGAYGSPELGAISSGLGEIFQFTVRGEGYGPMALREALDWYIAPQLRMVPGIVEVNSFGGEAKEYQVEVDPLRLQAAGLTLRDVVDALQASNGNAGGGYIERDQEQLVIGSSGLLRGTEDIASVVVGRSPAGVPVTIGQLASKVAIGAKLRRGSASIDGQGEVAVGVAMMLIGENARTVTEAVKQQIAAITPSLPKGMRIEPFYDRAALVDRTIGTVIKNLAEGAALVMLVLLLLLGDLRAGLIVALVIPLAMLFAILLMNAFGMSGNLMSMGALDFGLIVDGAVIIVENAVRRLGEVRAARARLLSTDERTETIRHASVEMLSASIFGQGIIAVVYLPILGLRGVEGKLFHPMASTVLFALLGAFVLSVTLVPVLASVLLRPSAHGHATVLMRLASRGYAPVLAVIQRRRAVVVGLGVLALAATVVIAGRIGAEFVPKLDEGDVLVEVRRLPGVALSESVATDRRMQLAILTVPEVAHVVSKTGAPELANDPMGIEQTDLYIQLKPEGTWRRGLGKAAVGDAIAAALEAKVPEVAGSISQPIEMRTNELVAGVRSDVAVVIYGPDLEELQRQAEHIAAVVGAIPGTADVRMEQGQGLTYLRIEPDRQALAQRGLTIADVNLLTEALAVGHAAGVIFEGDRRFDLAVKLGGVTGDLADIAALPLRSRDGATVPLGDVARVYTMTGPGLVNRNAQSRRLTVEFNVRGRDLVSVVDDARRAIAAKVTLAPGYRLAWGGQFENFVSARQRLLIVVPLALISIAFLLWLALGGVKPALLIFINVPFAVIGGIMALWLRGIPFSISAGVGFIALFGVAVLNGLVLVQRCRELERAGASGHDAIAEAARSRLRPVLMTALVAALGFIPMALSHAPGSEVQRPLATVVIGGLVTATLLTLFLFPAVYSLTSKRRRTPPGVPGETP